MRMRATTDLRAATTPGLLGLGVGMSLGLMVLLAACGGEAPTSASVTDQRPAVPGSAQQVEAEVGGATVTAVAIQTSQLPDAVAAEHGIQKRDDRVMLRVSARQGESGNVTTAPVQVRATVSDLRGGARPIELSERVTNGLVDHVGTVETALPSTLRFEIAVTTARGESETLEFSRRFAER